MITVFKISVEENIFCYFKKYFEKMQMCEYNIFILCKSALFRSKVNKEVKGLLAEKWCKWHTKLKLVFKIISTQLSIINLLQGFKLKCFFTYSEQKVYFCIPTFISFNISELLTNYQKCLLYVGKDFIFGILVFF